MSRNLKEKLKPGALVKTKNFNKIYINLSGDLSPCYEIDTISLVCDYKFYPINGVEDRFVIVDFVSKGAKVRSKLLVSEFCDIFDFVE